MEYTRPDQSECWYSDLNGFNNKKSRILLAQSRRNTKIYFDMLYESDKLYFDIESLSICLIYFRRKCEPNLKVTEIYILYGVFNIRYINWFINYLYILIYIYVIKK